MGGGEGGCLTGHCQRVPGVDSRHKDGYGWTPSAVAPGARTGADQSGAQPVAVRRVQSLNRRRASGETDTDGLTWLSTLKWRY